LARLKWRILLKSVRLPLQITKKEIGMGSQAEAFDAEKWALAKCIHWATKHTDEHPHNQINTLKIYIDNAAIIKAVYEITPSSGQGIGKIIRKGIDEWLSKDERRRIRIAWIPAHTDIRGNEEADKLAKAACSKPDEFKISTRAYMLHKSKEEHLKEWRERWLDTVGKGRFAWANRRPPSWKPPPHLTNNSNRNVYGRLMQSQLGHTHVGEYYRDFNIPEEHACPCGESYQTRIHILTECPLYEEHRHLLQDDKFNIIPTDLFGTKKGVTRYTEFLTKMNAFARNAQD
jgi:ribonuclease HI